MITVGDFAERVQEVMAPRQVHSLVDPVEAAEATNFGETPIEMIRYAPPNLRCTVSLGPSNGRWQTLFEWLARPISGESSRLSAVQITVDMKLVYTVSDFKRLTS